VRGGYGAQGSGMGHGGGHGTQTQKKTDEDPRRQRRLERNRASAKLRRQRKKSGVELCEQRVESLERAVREFRNHQWGAGSAERLHDIVNTAYTHTAAGGGLGNSSWWRSGTSSSSSTQRGSQRSHREEALKSLFDQYQHQVWWCGCGVVWRGV